MTINIRGTDYEENLNNRMGLEFYDLSHPWGLGQPCWPYFEDVKIERLHSMAKSGVLTQRITTVMHSGIVEEVLARWESVTGGNAGLSVPSASLFGMPLDSTERFYVLCLVCVVGSTLVALNLLRSPSGRAFVAIRSPLTE